MRAIGFAGAAVAFGASILAACAVGSTDAQDDGANFADAGALEGPPDPVRADGGADSAAPAGDSGTQPDTGVPSKCASALAGFTYDFASDQGWTHAPSDGVQTSGVTWPFDPWSRGTSPTLACPSGACFGAELTQNYAQCSRGELVSPKIDLSPCKTSKVSLVFTHAYSFWTGSWAAQTWFDGGIVEISGDDGATWSVPTASWPGTVKINPDQTASYACVMGTQFHVNGKGGFVQTQTTPSKFEISLPASAVTDKFRVRFAQGAGVSSQTTSADASRAGAKPGWRIDDVHFVEK